MDVGTLTVVASFEGIRTQIWSQWSLNILINAVQIFITAFIVLFIYQVLVSRHLSDMAAYAQQLSIDNLDPQLVLKRKHARDELGLVVDAINDLRERLKQGIEKREKAEEVLRKYEYIVSSSSDLLSFIDPTYTYQAVNASYLKVHQKRLDDIIGHTVADIHGDDIFKTIIKKELDKCLNGERINYQAWFTYNETDRRFMDVIYSPYIDASNDISGIVASARDITAQKEMELQLVRAQKMEAIGTLAGGIAHDFNNILSPIMAYAEMAMMDISTDSAIQQQYFRQIYKAAERARDLVKQILAFARSREEERIPLKASLIVKEAITFLKSTIPSTIDVQLDYRAQNDSILADPTQINQIVMNLCTNAAHAMRENGGVLEVRLSNEDIGKNEPNVLGGMKPGQYLKLSVRDTGSGISTEILDKLFEPYFTTKPTGEGTGLGLAVVHGIVKSYGGEIAVESEVHKGSAFHVYLPIFKSDIALIADPKNEIPTGDERILLVDDEKIALEPMQLMLEKLGYKLTVRTSSVEALEAFRNNPERFDLIITDMTMPNMTGKKLAKELIDIRPAIPIILCTGFSDQIDEKIAQEIGVRAFVMKPVAMRDMAETIRKVLHTKKV